MLGQVEGEGQEPGSETRFAEGTSCHVQSCLWQTQFTTTKGAHGLKHGMAGCPCCVSPHCGSPGDPRRRTLPTGLLGSPGSGHRRTAAAGRAQSGSRHAPSGAAFGLCRCIPLRGRVHGGTFPGRGQKAPRPRLLRDSAGLGSAWWRPSCESVWQLKIIGKQLSFRSSQNTNYPVTMFH